MEKRTKIQWAACLSISMLMLIACADYLDVKPNRSLATPNTLKDLRAILDNETRRNVNFPVAGDIASDYYYLDDMDFLALGIDARSNYLWHSDTEIELDWYYMYLNIFDSNVVLEQVDDAALGNLSEADRDRIKGTALFYRGWCFFQLAQLFAPSYEVSRANDLLGVPLRLSPDIEYATYRASLSETYSQILDDLITSAALLPRNTPVAVQPDKAASHAALARVYLIMGDYQNSLLHANASLELHDNLINYSELSLSVNKPIAVLNEEVIWHAQASNGGGVFVAPRAKVNPKLYALYDEGDLRKQAYFQEAANGKFYFKGDYGTNVGVPFAGLATDEVILTKAECLARLGKVDSAIETLNELLETRWEKDKYDPLYADGVADALKLIINERFKGLAFRAGIRWSDLRRLNNEPEFAQVITREIEGVTYSLQPDDNRYTFLIPNSVVQMTDVAQNNR